ncbi:MAG: CbbBc protein [Roseateles depolymerans]|uniref:CbbBc protein n=1 Tax=Roseateles depolymerans TaxID=76731 RepID=A0A2W5DNA4_9BURK|nr:MAG: CbbBc protein [Roseateles depolymerans]
MGKEDTAGRIEPYTHPAAGWGAVKQVALAFVRERVAANRTLSLFAQNQPEGFDCPGCAWPDKETAATFEFCENGVKAVAAESTSRRVTPAFFAAHTVTELLQWSDYELEQQGRLTEPMVYDASTDTYVAIAWEDAFELMARELKALPTPDAAAFYTSGRASNESAFLYQLFVRAYGTNNFPDCSNMCHEATSRGLPTTVGVGKATVTLDDFEHCDTVLIFGQNPATNHPRMLGTLREVSRRGATIVAINPLRERGLERFTDPQSPVEMLTLGSTNISSVFVRPRLGGDLALILAVAKRLIEWDEAARLAGEPPLLDWPFITAHCSGFEAYEADLRAQPWAVLIDESGVPFEEIDALARIYARGKAVIATWGMGLTQHKHSVATVQALSNLMMLRGNVGREGAGLMPVRGHSNVQGNRTVGIENQPTPAFTERLAQAFGFEPPRREGMDVVETIAAMRDGRVRFFFGLGGNFAMATPDSELTWQALRRCELTAHVTTKLNRSHLIHGRQALILPTLGRTEIDEQGGVAQGVTVEDSVCMVHLSYGMNRPASPQLRSEVAIVAGLAQATLGARPVDWQAMAADYRLIRDAIAKAIPGFENFNERVARERGFHLDIASRRREWLTASGKAQFVVANVDLASPIHRARARHGEQLMVLMTTRSHDQYNTTVYALNDRYRGVFGQRRVVFIHRDDIAMLGFEPGDWVDLIGVWDDGQARRADRFKLVEYDIPRGCIAAYYPETNPLVPLASVGDVCGTPTSKSIPVLLQRSA